MTPNQPNPSVPCELLRTNDCFSSNEGCFPLESFPVFFPALRHQVQAAGFEGDEVLLLALANAFSVHIMLLCLSGVFQVAPLKSSANSRYRFQCCV